jgi:hypothetical protein
MKQKQRIINKVYLVSVIRDSKVIDIIRGKCLEDIEFLVKTKYRDCEMQVMEYNDEYNIYVPDIEEHLMMIRRRQANHFPK